MEGSSRDLLKWNLMNWLFEDTVRLKETTGMIKHSGAWKSREDLTTIRQKETKEESSHRDLQKPLAVKRAVPYHLRSSIREWHHQPIFSSHLRVLAYGFHWPTRTKARKQKTLLYVIYSGHRLWVEKERDSGPGKAKKHYQAHVPITSTDGEAT